MSYIQLFLIFHLSISLFVYLALPDFSYCQPNPCIKYKYEIWIDTIYEPCHIFIHYYNFIFFVYIFVHLAIPEFNYCEPNPCMNDGVCELVEYENIGGFRCICRSGFYGLKCETGKFIWNRTPEYRKYKIEQKL